MPAPEIKVNLLPPSDFESSFWGRFLKWAVTTGRYIIILTELVVIIAFLSRFKLDEDLRNLNEQINGQVSYLQLQTDQEQEFLGIQKRLKLAEKMWLSRVGVAEYLDYLEEKIPPDVAVKVRTVTPGELAFTASTLNEGGLGRLLATMSADMKWASVDVTELTNSKTNGIKFSLFSYEAGGA